MGRQVFNSTHVGFTQIWYFGPNWAPPPQNWYNLHTNILETKNLYENVDDFAGVTPWGDVTHQITAPKDNNWPI